jgi:hypothetical protein
LAIGAIVAASVIAVLISLTVRNQRGNRAGAARPAIARESSPDSAASVASLFVSTGMVLAEANAAEVPHDPTTLAQPMPALDGRRLRAGSLEFRTTVTVRGMTSEIGRMELDIHPAVWNGDSAWQIVERYAGLVDGQQRVEVDSQLLSRKSMRLLRRAVRVTPYSRFPLLTINQRFPGDSVTGEMTAQDQGGRVVRRPIRRVLSRTVGPYVTDALAPVATMLVPVARSWSGRVAVLGWAVRDSDVYYPAALRVSGAEAIRIGDQTIDCWRIEITTTMGSRTSWVRRSDGVAVRVLQRAANGAAYETVLTHESWTSAPVP